jgi:hypothetical protein
VLKQPVILRLIDRTTCSPGVVSATNQPGGLADPGDGRRATIVERIDKTAQCIFDIAKSSWSCLNVAGPCVAMMPSTRNSRRLSPWYRARLSFIRAAWVRKAKIR